MNAATPSVEVSSSDLKRRIMELQDIQRANPFTSEAWQKASEELQPLFTEMARRFPAEGA